MTYTIQTSRCKVDPKRPPSQPRKKVASARNGQRDQPSGQAQATERYRDNYQRNDFGMAGGEGRQRHMVD